LASPLALILPSTAAQEEHIREHGGDKDFDKGDVKTSHQIVLP
jgi:hypothetical protein